jgi:hypothetical protein
MSLAADAEQLIRRLAPRDLRNTPLYVVPQSWLPGELRVDRCGGSTGPVLDLQLEPTLRDRGEWRGRGAAMIVNDEMLADLPEREQRLYFRSIAVHEAAHILERPELFSESSASMTPETLREGALSTARFLSSSVADPSMVAMMHPPLFGRIAVHLIARCSTHALDLPTVLGVTDAWNPGCGFYSLKAALPDNETDRLTPATFAHIRALPIPTSFTALWETNTYPQRVTA